MNFQRIEMVELVKSENNEMERDQREQKWWSKESHHNRKKNLNTLCALFCINKHYDDEGKEEKR